MADLDIQGILLPSLMTPEQSTVLYPYFREVFINEAPLATRGRREQAEAESYSIITYDIRPLTYTLAAAVTGSGTPNVTVTTITLTDASPLQVGDVLSIPNTAGSAFERLEVVADPNVAANTVQVKRGVEGTALVANDFSTGNFLTLQLFGNSRTGGEINQTANRAVRIAIPQNVQTFQHPIQVGGKVMAVQNIRLPAGFSNVFTLEEKVKATEMMVGQEMAMYYGLGDKPNGTTITRAKQSGLKKLIGYYGSPDSGVTPGPNVVGSLGGSFTKFNMIQKLQLAINGGGRPNVVICSLDFFTAISTWSLGAQFITEGTTKIGTPIDGFWTAFLGRPIYFMPSFHMLTGSFFGLTWEDVIVRQLRPEQIIRRGVQGDAMQADMLCDTCIEIGHPGWHVHGFGITGYA